MVETDDGLDFVWKNDWWEGENDVKLIDFFPVSEAVQKAPPEDVVEIVRCKDCKWRDHINCAIEEDEYGYHLSENDFCSFGERKEGEQNDCLH